MAVAPPPKPRRIPRDLDDLYPVSDGKPMAESDLHGEQMTYCKKALQAHHADRSDVYVSGNNFLYWQEGDPRKVVSPDCYVVFGVPKRLRDTYMVWKEGGILPDVVIEITSKKTRREDQRVKQPLYEQVLRVPEYFRFDPTGDYLKPRLQGVRLKDGRYEPIELRDGRMFSERLKLFLVVDGERMRFFDPEQDAYLLSYEEHQQRAEKEARRADEEANRADEEANRADEEANRADEEANRAANAEAEIARLRTELEALRERSP